VKRILVQCEKKLTKVALLEDERLVEFFAEQTESRQRAGDIYKGKVMNVLPGMQAAFVDIGLERNAFLYIDDVLPACPGQHPKEKPSIEEVLAPGQELLVQVTKEAAGTKGARITMHFSIPGRRIVYMPEANYVGISRKIESDGERARLKAAAESFRRVPEGLIVRTAASGQPEEVLLEELETLRRTWSDILARAAAVTRAPGLVYRDLDTLPRMVRDLLDREVEEIVIDAEDKGRELMSLLKNVSEPNRVHLFKDHKPLFNRYGIDAELEKCLRRKIWLESGAYIIVEPTEALTVIDVNTGKYTGSVNLEQTVFETNLEAAVEIARIIRLRDLGGMIIVDFIDMEEDEHRQRIVQALEKELRKDRTKALVVGWTRLGLLEMTRKKVREPLDELFYAPCTYCQGTGRHYSSLHPAFRSPR
jgi:ribonuclease G